MIFIQERHMRKVKQEERGSFFAVLSKECSPKGGLEFSPPNQICEHLQAEGQKSPPHLPEI